MKFSPTLAGVAVAITLPKFLPDAVSWTASTAYSTAKFLGGHAWSGGFAAVCWTARNTLSAWENYGSPLAGQGLEKIQELASSALISLGQPTGETLLGYTITYGAVAGTLAASMAAGAALAFILPQKAS